MFTLFRACKQVSRHYRRAVFGLLLAVTCSHAAAAPPYGGTIFLDPDVITATDPTVFTGLTYAGRGQRLMFDRRVDSFVQRDAYLFNANFSDLPAVEIQVNPEFASVALAQAVALQYAPVIGRLPRGLRRDVKTVWIHQGDKPFGGGNNNLLIHTGSIAQSYIAGGILEEALAHEAAHTSLDALNGSSAGWLAAQAADREFISTYARDNPTREDIAESLLPWLAVRFARSRISSDYINTVERTIPNRLRYFDGLNLELAPVPIPGATKYVVSHPYFRDDRGTGATSDWAPGQYKAEGGTRSALAGIGTSYGFGPQPLYALFRTTFSATDHFLSPSAAYPGSCYRRTWGQYDNRFLQSGDDPVAYSDWDYGYYKAQCGKNEYVAGISQDPASLEMSSLLCCFHDDLNRVRNTCSASRVGGPSESSTAGNWANAKLGTCGEGRFVGGISKTPWWKSGFDFAHNDPHALLCCN
jgi:hypothetical protein